MTKLEIDKLFLARNILNRMKRKGDFNPEIAKAIILIDEVLDAPDEPTKDDKPGRKPSDGFVFGL